MWQSVAHALLYSCPTHSADTYYDGEIDRVAEYGCGSSPVCTAVLPADMACQCLVHEGIVHQKWRHSLHHCSSCRPWSLGCLYCLDGVGGTWSLLIIIK